MRRILFLSALLLSVCCSTARAADEPFANGWHKTVKLTDANAEGESSVCIAWVDEGWLIVERGDVSGDIEWQIVLAQVGEDDEPPTIEPNPNPKVPGGLRVSYRGGLFFIRDDLGSLRCVRQKKSADAKWPSLFIPESEPPPAGVKSRAPGGRVHYFRINHEWQFIAGGREREQAEYVLRMKHPEVEANLGVLTESNDSDVIRMWVTGPMRPDAHYSRWASLIDDGELLVVQRVRERDVERMHPGRQEQERMEARRKAPPGG